VNYESYVQFLKTTFKDAGVKLVMKYLVSQIPFFRLAFINPIAAFFVGKVISIAVDKTELGAFFLFIDLRISAQGRAFEQVALLNYEVQKNGTKEEKLDAEEKLIEKFRELVKFSN
jgi:hypothetical protein